MAGTRKKFTRVLLKMSGEALDGDRGYGLDVRVVNKIAQEIKEVTALGTRLGIVVGGGNIFRGVAASARGMDRIQADYLGMLATLFNAVAIRETLLSFKAPAVVLSSLPIPALAETYYPQVGRAALDQGKVLLLAAGTGNPYFTTDTAAALRAAELGAQVILKATQVDGVYDDDPRINPQAKRYQKMDYDQVLQGRLEVMDATAVSLARENRIPIIVFNGLIKGNLKKIISGVKVGTIIKG
jgi:uridylate kinase